MKKSGEQKTSSAAKTIHPAVLILLATTGCAVVPQCGQRKFSAETRGCGGGVA